MFYTTKTQLLNKISRHYKNIREVEENEKQIIIIADNVKLEINKVKIVVFKYDQITAYSY